MVGKQENQKSGTRDILAFGRNVTRTEANGACETKVTTIPNRVIYAFLACVVAVAAICAEPATAKSAIDLLSKLVSQGWELRPGK